MRRCLLPLLFALSGLALAGGGGAPTPGNRPAVSPVTPRLLPATSPVLPGQTWVLTGTTARGEHVWVTFPLAPGAPSWDDGWDFQAAPGLFSYDPESRFLTVAELTPYVQARKPIRLCLGFLEGRRASGVLISGTKEEVYAQLDLLEGDATTPAELRRAVAAAGMTVGSCTVTRR